VSNQTQASGPTTVFVGNLSYYIDREQVWVCVLSLSLSVSQFVVTNSCLHLVESKFLRRLERLLTFVWVLLRMEALGDLGMLNLLRLKLLRRWTIFVNFYIFHIFSLVWLLQEQNISLLKMLIWLLITSYICACKFWHQWIFLLLINSFFTFFIRLLNLLGVT
jgi:hypothetical protein